MATETVTADQLAQIVSELRTTTNALNQYLSTYERELTGSRGAADATFKHWFGPRADSALDVIAGYLDVLDEVAPAIQAQIDISDAMKSSPRPWNPSCGHRRSNGRATSTG